MDLSEFSFIPTPGQITYRFCKTFYYDGDTPLTRAFMDGVTDAVCDINVEAFLDRSTVHRVWVGEIHKRYVDEESYVSGTALIVTIIGRYFGLSP